MTAAANSPTLHCMVGVDASVLSFPLFQHFLRHYVSQGVSHVVLDLHSNAGDAARIRLFRETAEATGAVIRHVIEGAYTSHSNHTALVNSFLADYGAESRWCLLVDADELVVFPGGVRAFLSACDAHDRNVVVGTLTDRFSLDNPFPVIGPEDSLDELFPWAYPLTRRIRGGLDRKVVAVRGRFSCVEGKHRLVEERSRVIARERTVSRLTDLLRHDGWRERLVQWHLDNEPTSPGIRRWRGRLAVHHFAWDATLRHKMEVRAGMPGLTHRPEIERVLAFVRHPNPSSLLKRHLLRPARIERS